MTNPLVSQGTLNRLQGAVYFNNYPQLNVTAPFLGAEGIHLSLEGESTTFINTMTGSITSPEPYQRVSIAIHLLRTQYLANLYKLQLEANAIIGDVTVYPDSSALSTYSFFNCALEAVRDLTINGKDPGYVATIKGYYMINQALWI